MGSTEWVSFLHHQSKKNHKLNHCKLGTACAIYAISSVVALQWASLVAQRLKHLPPMQEIPVRSLGREDPLEKEMVTHSSIPMDGGAR